MASTNTGSKIYLSKLDGSSKCYMDLDPSPFPTWQLPERMTVSDQMLPGSNESGDPEAGQFVHFDGGAHITGSKLTLNCPYISDATYTALEILYFELADVLYSPDDGDTIYQVQWLRLQMPQEKGRQTRSLNAEFRYVTEIEV